MSNPPSNLIDFLKANDNFLIAVHFDPDGDCLGSASALSDALRSIGKKTSLFCETPVSDPYSFMPGSEDFKGPGQLASTDCNTLIIVDANSLKRVVSPKNSGFFSDFRGQTAVIDHHETEALFGDVKWIEPDTPATGMMVHALIKKMNIKITERMAINLYTAIVVDTGNFRFDNVNSDVLLAASELAAAGASPAYIYSELHESWSLKRLMLFKAVIETLTIDDGMAFMHVSRQMYDKTGADAADTENFVSFPRVVKDLRVLAFIKETEDHKFKISLRSKGDINVARVAEKFGGGGHKNAAGCVISNDLDSVKDALKKELKKLV
ncbi:MAG: bifunctional oligoribonuclease/PAP phosphatase NrnA [Dissulfurispiraceae bacterium]|jgi:phosphoesterase RecJ-like protein|nr:bifunctional oligoribonuclease/PAP phosphatase NrnA [Dissulfurispiraceae bacterium]